MKNVFLFASLSMLAMTAVSGPFVTSIRLRRLLPIAASCLILKPRLMCRYLLRLAGRVASMILLELFQVRTLLKPHLLILTLFGGV